MQIWRHDEHRDMAWANGGGRTLEVLRTPVGSPAPDLRLSFASIERSGPFSRLPGLDRVFVLAAGDALTLTVDGAEHALRRFDQLAFPGDAAADAVIVAPCTAFNVMARTGRVRAEVSVHAVAGVRDIGIEGTDTYLAVLDGAITARPQGTQPVSLTAWDVARLTAPTTLTGAGVIAVVRVASAG